MIRVPYLAPENSPPAALENPFSVGVPYGPTSMMMVDGPDGAVPADLGQPSITIASMILLLLLLKAFTESRFVSFNPQEAKISLFSILSTGTQAATFIILLKVVSAGLLKRGVIVPGLAETAGAL